MASMSAVYSSNLLVIRFGERQLRNRANAASNSAAVTRVTTAIFACAVVGLFVQIELYFRYFVICHTRLYQLAVLPYIRARFGQLIGGRAQGGRLRPRERSLGYCIFAWVVNLDIATNQGRYISGIVVGRNFEHIGRCVVDVVGTHAGTCHCSRSGADRLGSKG